MSRRLRPFALLALLALVACGRDTGGAPPDDEPSDGASGGKAGTTFVYARGKASPTLDPAEATDGESALVLVNVFDTLVRYVRGGPELEPGLAVSWEDGKDGMSTTFVLREGVTFHDGAPLDADAVVANFERQRDPEHRWHFSPRYPYWGDLLDFVRKVTAVDARTVRFEFSAQPPAFFLHLMALFTNGIVSPRALAKGKDYVARNPVGTGAFRFVAWEGDEIRLARNDAWWGGAPGIERLSFVVVPDVRTAFLRLETGQVHGIDNVAARDVARVRGDARFRLEQVEAGLSVCYLAMNNDKPPFDDVRVRRAVALAIDKKRIVDAAYEGLATPISTLLPPGVAFHAAIPDRLRDTEAAKQLLAEAGAAGRKVELRFPSNPRPYLPDPNALAAQLRDDLRDIGLEVTLRKEEWAAYLKQVQNGEHEMCVLGWTPDVPDADNYLHVLLSKDSAKKPTAQNVSFYRSEAFHERVAKARYSRDEAERRRLYAEAQQIAFDDAPMVPLIAQPRTAATLSGVEGFRLEPVSSPRFAWTRLRK